MRGVLHVLTALVVMALGVWAYRENYRTQDALREVRSLHAEIGAAHARLRMLRAEWAYLNRPDRLRDLALINFDRLGLIPMRPEAFGRISQIPMPPAPLSPLMNPVTLSSDMAPRNPDEEPL
jgi:hypothetical protein